MNDRVRVGVVVTKFAAGAGGVALRGAMALDTDRYDVSIMTSPGGDLFERATEAGLKVTLLDYMAPDVSPRSDARGVRELAGLFERDHFDIVHTHSAKAGALGRLAARRAGVPAVHTLHGFPFHDFQSRARRHAFISIERRLGRITAQFLAIGGAVAADAIRLGIATPDRVRVIASAVEASIAPVSPETRRAARRVLSIPAGMKVIGTVGRLDFQKAPLDMVSAVAKMGRRDVFGIWIGDGPLLEKAQRAARDAGLEKRFKFLGQRNDVADLLPAFDVFAMSSLYEGVPCALVEGMLCGIPAVATAVNGVPDVVVHGRTGLLARPGDPSSIARALDHLLLDPQRAETMAAAARSLVLEEFQPRRLGKALDETFSDALDGALRPAGAVVTEIRPADIQITASLEPVHVSRRER